MEGDDCLSRRGKMGVWTLPTLDQRTSEKRLLEPHSILLMLVTQFDNGHSQKTVNQYEVELGSQETRTVLYSEGFEGDDQPPSRFSNYASPKYLKRPCHLCDSWQCHGCCFMDTECQNLKAGSSHTQPR